MTKKEKFLKARDILNQIEKTSGKTIYARIKKIDLYKLFLQFIKLVKDQDWLNQKGFYEELL